MDVALMEWWDLSGKHHRVEVADGGHAVATLLLAGRDGDPLFVDVIAPNGACLAVGTGMPDVVLAYQQSADPPYYVSVGGRAGSDVVVFYYGGQDSEFLESNLVASSEAEAAVREFVRSGQRPTAVSWEEV